MYFITVSRSVFSMLSFIIIGFALVKLNLAETQHGKSLSSFLIYCATPGMFISSFQEIELSGKNNTLLIYFFLVSLAAQILMFLIMYLFFRKKIRQTDNGKYKILVIGSFMGNVGFFGQPVLTTLFPDYPIAPCYCMMFATSMNLLMFTIGEYMISGNKKYISVKRAFLNPTVLSVIVAIILYALNIKLPALIIDVTSILRNMAGPVCMILLGFRLASMNFREIFCQPFAYLVSLLKLIIFPLIAYLITLLFPGLDYVFRTSILISASVPCASMILALSEIHSCEQNKAAYSVLITSVLCGITIPLLSLIIS